MDPCRLSGGFLGPQDREGRQQQGSGHGKTRGNGPGGNREGPGKEGVKHRS